MDGAAGSLRQKEEGVTERLRERVCVCLPGQVAAQGEEVAALTAQLEEQRAAAAAAAAERQGRSEAGGRRGRTGARRGETGGGRLGWRRARRGTCSGTSR